jgi:hypothetical protein
MVPPSAVLPTGENFGFTTQKVPNKNKQNKRRDKSLKEFWLFFPERLKRV